MYTSNTTRRKLHILCCLIALPQNGGRGGRLFYILGDRRGAYLKEAHDSRIYRGILVTDHLDLKGDGRLIKEHHMGEEA